MQLIAVSGVTGVEPHLCMQLVDLCVPHAEVLPPVHVQIEHILISLTHVNNVVQGIVLVISLLKEDRIWKSCSLLLVVLSSPLELSWLFRYRLPPSQPPAYLWGWPL